MHVGGVNARLVVVCAVGLIAVAACRDKGTTEPSEVVATQTLANHFDSLYKAALADTDTVYAQNLASIIERFPAYGSQLDTFFVTTAAGSDRYFGFGAMYVNTAAGDIPGDSSFVAVAYSDTTFATVMVLEEDYPSAGSPTGSAVLLQNRFSTSVAASQVTIGSTVDSIGSTCSLQSGLAADSIVRPFGAGYACVLATMGVSATVQFPVSAALGGLQSWAFSNVILVGSRFTAAASGADVGGAAVSRATLTRLLRIAHSARTGTTSPRIRERL